MRVWKVIYKLNTPKAEIEEVYVAVNSYSDFFKYLLSINIEEDEVISIEAIRIENC